MKLLKSGLLISVEGIDGSGKSTLASLLSASLQREQLPVSLTFEPGDTQLGTQLRELLQKKSLPMCDLSEYLLYATDRAQHFEEVIKPLLHEKKIIISDRMADSSLAYQGYGRGLNTDMIQAVNTWAMQNIAPDITLYVKISLETSMARLKARKTIPTAMEQEKADFTQRVISGFETIFHNRSNVIVLDGEQTPQEIHTVAHQALMHHITNKHLIV